MNYLRKTDEFKTAFEAFRAERPELFFALLRHNRLEREQIHEVLLDVWRYTDLPSAWPTHLWICAFQTAGFLSDGLPRPKRPMIVYRGCAATGRRGLAWTLHRFRAEYFADYWYEHQQAPDRGHVYQLRIKPGDVLAIISGHKIPLTFSNGVTAHVGGEDEVIVDARFLHPRLVETARQRLAREEREERAVAERFKRESGE